LWARAFDPVGLEKRADRADNARRAAGAGGPTSGLVKDSPGMMAARVSRSERALAVARLATAVAAPSAASARAADSARARAVAACEVATARLFRADAASFAQACIVLDDSLTPLNARQDRRVTRQCMSDLAPAAPLLERHLATLEGA